MAYTKGNEAAALLTCSQEEKEEKEQNAIVAI